MSRNAAERQRQLNEQYAKGTVRSPADMEALKRFWESEEQLTASTELPRKSPSRALSRKSGLSMSNSLESSAEDAPLPSPRRSPSQSGLPKNSQLITKIFSESEGLDSSEYGAADASPSPRGGRKQAELERARAEQEAREKEERKAQRKAEREREKERLREAAESDEREAEEERFRQEAEARRRKREEIEAQKRKIEEEKAKLEMERRKHEEAMALLARQREQQEELERQQAAELANSKRKKKKKQKEEIIEEEPEEEQGDFAFNENSEYQGEENDATFIFKLVMVGDSAVGKSSILSRWSHNEFAKDLKATISVESHVKMFKIKRDVIKAQLWDTAGQEKFRSITAQYYRGAKGILIVFDVTKRTSFESVDKWLNEVHNVSDASIPIILIGNKKDMVKNRSVTTEEAIEYSKDHGLNYIETSAKNGSNCARAISMLLEDVYKSAKSPPVLQAKAGEEKKAVPKSQPIVIDAYERAHSGDPFGESVPETGGYKGPDDCANC